MPAMSKPHPHVEEAFDVRVMSRLQEHPSLRPLFERQVGLHQRRGKLVDEVRVLRQQLHDAPSGEGFTAAASRRTLQDQIHEREREGAEIEDELQLLGTEIEDAEGPIMTQIGDLRTAESVGVLARFVHALEEMTLATEAYRVCSQKNYGLLRSYLLPQELVDPLLPARLQAAQTRLMQFQKAATR